MLKLNRYLKRAFWAGLALVAGAILYDRGARLLWDGRTDLTVDFVVTDAATGQPIEGAEIAIVSSGGLNADGYRLQETGRKTEEFVLKTDGSGTARYVCRGCMRWGSTSGLGLTTTYSVYLPRWCMAARAPGYAETEPFFLNDAHQRAANAGPKARIVVSVALHKSQQ